MPPSRPPLEPRAICPIPCPAIRQPLVRVGLTQMACGEDADANLARQLALAEQAAAGGAQIVCTQELFRSQYFCQVEDHRFFQLAETIPGPSTEAFQSSPAHASS